MLQEMERAANRALTENGALSNWSTGSHCLNFFAVCGALRNADRAEVCRLFVRAYAEDRDLAMRALFYARDIRGGLGERKVFRSILSWLARRRPQSAIKNIPFVPEYGRWDDLLALLDTPCEEGALSFIREQLDKDIDAAREGGQVSLLAKWLPSVNTSSQKRRAEARLVCKRLGMTEKEYRGTLTQLRTQIDVLEKRLCGRDYSFEYAKQPSGAMHKYRKAFLRHDHDRYTDYIDKVLQGEAQLHAGTLYPYEIIRECLINDEPALSGPWSEVFLRPRKREELSPELIRSLDASWKSLPDYGDDRNALAIVDGSGSMFMGGDPLPAEVATSLGIYFAEHNTGFFRDHFMTFSWRPRLVKLEGDNIADRALYCMSFNEVANTDLRAAFMLILNTAVENHLPQEELPETLYILSDMEFDAGVKRDMTLFEEIRDLYACHGYRLPSLVYWNVNCRSEQFPVCKDENGTVLVSGASPSLFRMVIEQDITPERFMLSVLNSERYSRIAA